MKIPDVSAVKQALRGRWAEALSTLGGCPSEILDGKNHPCPKCGGRDRFRMIDAEAGAVFCNQCFNEKNGDGIAALEWLTGRSFQEVLTDLERFTGNGKKPTKTYATPEEVITSVYCSLGKRSGDWAYHNAERELVGRILRFDTPEGKQYRPVSLVNGRWIAGGMAEPWPLYCLPEIADARRVYVCEGEKAADAARSIGFVATTSPHGSQSPHKADWKPLAGKEIVILPDADEAGVKYAEAIKTILLALEPRPVVKVVNLPGLPEAGDIVEWIDSHGDSAEPDSMREEIEALASAAVEAVDEKLPAFAKLIDSATLAAWDTQPEFLTTSILVKGQPAIVGGRSKTLKTGLAIDLAVSLGSGTPFLGHFTTRQVNVAIWSGESGISTIRNTALRIAEARGVSLPDCSILWAFDLPLPERDFFVKG